MSSLLTEEYVYLTFCVAESCVASNGTPIFYTARVQISYLYILFDLYQHALIF